MLDSLELFCNYTFPFNIFQHFGLPLSKIDYCRLRTIESRRNNVSVTTNLEGGASLGLCACNGTKQGTRRRREVERTNENGGKTRRLEGGCQLALVQCSEFIENGKLESREIRKWKSAGMFSFLIYY